AALSGRVRGRVVVVAADGLAQLRHDLHRAVHVAAAGKRGRLRQGFGDDVRERSAWTADVVLRHGGQQRASIEHDAARSGAAARGQELRAAGGTGPRALRAEHAADDGVLHREPRFEPDEAKGLIKSVILRSAATKDPYAAHRSTGVLRRSAPQDDALFAF